MMEGTYPMEWTLLHSRKGNMARWACKCTILLEKMSHDNFHDDDDYEMMMVNDEDDGHYQNL